MIKEREKEVWHSMYLKNGNGYSGTSYKHHDDEIDLLELFIRTVSFFKKYSRMLILTSLIGGMAGGITYLFLMPLYKSEMVFNTTLLQKHELNQVVSMLNSYIAEKNTTVLKEYKFKPNLINEIEMLDTDDDVLSNTISVVVKDPDYLPQLQESIITFISSNEYVRQKVESDRTKINKTLQVLQSEEKRIDKSFSENSLSNSRDFEAAELLKLKMEIHKEMIDLENQRKNLAGLTVIQSFPQYSNPYNKNLLLTVVIGMGAFLIIAVIYAFSKEINKMAKHHMRQAILNDSLLKGYKKAS